MEEYTLLRSVSRRQDRRVSARRKRRRLAAVLLLLIACDVVILYKLVRQYNSAAETQTDSVASAQEDDTRETATNNTQEGSAAEAAGDSGEDALTAAEKLAIIQTSPEYPADMVEFAQKYEQAIDYVYNYPACKDDTPVVDLAAEASGDSVPLLIQWDARWGYAAYGDGLIGYTGCGPVSLSMVALYLTGDAQWTPVRVAEFAEQNEYYVSGSGSSWTLISEGCCAMGLDAEELPLTEASMKSALNEGRPIIAVVGPGDFTYNGHFIVIVGYDASGFLVNDPNSYENSAKTWSYDTLSGQIRNLWAMSAA